MTVSKKSGFTLIELLVVIGIIAVLAGIVIVALNPARQFAQARNAQRWSDMNALTNAIGQRIADNKGIFETGCAAGAIPATSTDMSSGAGAYNIGPCLVPTYMSALPYDPSAAGANYASSTSYDTGYSISKDSATGRVTISASSSELGVPISITR